eukprot:1791414-Prymnesium_polylepis.1
MGCGGSGGGGDGGGNGGGEGRGGAGGSAGGGNGGGEGPTDGGGGATRHSTPYSALASNAAVSFDVKARVGSLAMAVAVAEEPP